MERPSPTNERWRQVLEDGDEFKRLRWLFRRLPKGPRCHLCYAPFHGIGGAVLRTVKGLGPSTLNPHFCNDCELLGAEQPGGVEMPLAMLFADVRGSTSLAETLPPTEFSQLIDRFYRAAGSILIRADALIEKLMGDGVIAIFVPGLAGERYIGRAIRVGQDLLAATGHAPGAEPWIPIGVGVHFGPAFIGALGEAHGLATISAFGDTVIVAARLADAAGGGEMLVTRAASDAADLAVDGLPSRSLTLKGRSEPIDVTVFR